MRLATAAILLAAVGAPAAAQVAKPAAITADGVPALPVSLADALRPYAETRSAAPVAWNPVDKSLVITTRFANVAQLHQVARPMMDRRQITFEADRTSQAYYSPSGDVMLVQKDVGGGEFYQLYAMKDGRLTLLTDGKSRNGFGAFSRDGKLVGYSSTKRTGTDNDLYVMDPRDPTTARMVAQVSGGGWSFVDFLPGDSRAVVLNRASVQKSDLYDLDLATGTMTPLNDLKQQVAFGSAEVAPDGTLWVLADAGSDFQRLGTLKDNRFTPVSKEPRWDVEDFAIAKDGSFIAYVLNEDGTSRLKLLDPRTGQVREAAVPKGVIGGLEVAPWGDVAFSVSGSTVPGDVFVLDPRAMKVTQWTASETGGLDPSRNVAAELVRVKSFDGQEVSGLLYRPDPARFPGKRPLIIDIHGGPEGQTTASYRGAANYYVNELGIALFYPNVRGSTGYGKRFVSLDNGPFKREDSVRDIGAFLDHFARDPGIDAARIGEQGGSYGGYMCYAAAIRYGARLKGANCIVAISNWVTFLENTSGYRRDLRRVEYGDERDPKQKAKLLEISPMTRVSELRIPLMVVTGANDPRVPASEADQMVKAVRANGGIAWHILAADEGHGFAKKENRDYQNYATLFFWQANLLGTVPK
ncbi:Dipeptidyl aminopeptidase/acylaminoacyl peptidase [Sphingomonas guangdongensis]|uniref:Dipeptidyl aminopeptidase/acylaminoacyl peptidase n=1 Tax=Sphingomonas guangdongensis TaxID=1141890 RepID=A0A285QJT2_9SPHN|nr:prolyl oligopeptidase family serine peptidase [Sphingomonas guangdongensis]SOB80332.1 Dipeptidyl aminopeptidase/acylaminoacyl peptidase [Sphingomonas guangdongensis]